MTDNQKSTRDIVLELRGIVTQYLEGSKERRALLERRFDELREDRKQLEARIHCVEKKVWYASGAAAMASAVLTWLFGKH